MRWRSPPLNESNAGRRKLCRFDIGQRLGDDPAILVPFGPPRSEVGIPPHRDDLARPQRKRRLFPWGTNPIWRAIASRGQAIARRPPYSTSPRVGAASPSSSRAKVDFPAPLGPIRAVNWPDAMAQSTSTTASAVLPG